VYGNTYIDSIGKQTRLLEGKETAEMPVALLGRMKLGGQTGKGQGEDGGESVNNAQDKTAEPELRRYWIEFNETWAFL
jgi:hypothetical protein